MTDKNKSLNLLIEKERNETNEQLLIENRDLKQRISSLLAHISSLEYKLNNLYHQEEKEVKNALKLSEEQIKLLEDFNKLALDCGIKPITRPIDVEELNYPLMIPRVGYFDVEKWKKLIETKPSSMIVFEEEDYDSHLNKNKNE